MIRRAWGCVVAVYLHCVNCRATGRDMRVTRCESTWGGRHDVERRYFPTEYEVMPDDDVPPVQHVVAQESHMGMVNIGGQWL